MGQDGLLVAQNLDGVETVFIWDQALALPQVLGTSDGLRALYGLERIGVEQGGAWHYPQTDALGSVRQWTDAAGAVVGLQGYGPFGEPIVPLGPPLAPWGYTGEWHDPAGMVYLRARWYSPALGRFTQVDPVVGPLAAPATWQPYAYALNNPARYTDATGRFPWVVVGVAAAAGLIDYGIQVSRNRQAGLDWGAALTTNINVQEVLSVAGAAGLATIAVPELVSWAGVGLTSAGLGLYGLSQTFGAGSGAIPRYVASSAAWASTALWSAGAGLVGAAQTVAGAIYGIETYGLETCAAPNPYGRRGGPEHQSIVKEIADDIESRGLRPRTEFTVRTPGGVKSLRGVDVAGLDRLTGKPVEFHQVGDVTAAGGIPVKRERDAILDILLHGGFGGVPVWFHPKK